MFTNLWNRYAANYTTNTENMHLPQEYRDQEFIAKISQLKRLLRIYFVIT